MGTVERILIVEDEAKLADLMASRLRAAGNQVETQNSYRGAYEKAKACKPSLVILDVMKILETKLLLNLMNQI